MMHSGCVTADGKKEAFGIAPLYTRSIPHGVDKSASCRFREAEAELVARKRC